MQKFDTAIKKVLAENVNSFEDELIEVEKAFVENLTNEFIRLYDTYKVMFHTTIKSRRNTPLSFESNTAPRVVESFRDKLLFETSKEIKKLLETVTKEVWERGTNRELYTYLDSGFRSFFLTFGVFTDPESRDDLCISLIDVNHLPQFNQYGLDSWGESFKYKNIYYPQYIKSTISQSLEKYFLYLLSNIKKMLAFRVSIPYFKIRETKLKEQLAKKAYKNSDLNDLLDF